GPAGTGTRSGGAADAIPGAAAVVAAASAMADSSLTLMVIPLPVVNRRGSDSPRTASAQATTRKVRTVAGGNASPGRAVTRGRGLRRSRTHTMISYAMGTPLTAWPR